MFRFNTRKNINDGQRFALAMSQIGGKRLTYSELTGKDESARRNDRGGGNTNPLLALVCPFPLAWGSEFPALFPSADCSLGHFEKCYHSAFELLQCFRAFDVFGLLHELSVILSRTLKAIPNAMPLIKLANPKNMMSRDNPCTNDQIKADRLMKHNRKHTKVSTWTNGRDLNSLGVRLVAGISFWFFSRR